LRPFTTGGPLTPFRNDSVRCDDLGSETRSFRLTRSLFLSTFAALALAAPALASTQGTPSQPAHISAGSSDEAAAKPPAASEQQASVDEADVADAAAPAPERKVRVILDSPYGR
jgi:hypothetical protein